MYKNILLVCTGNSCRSPMAEGILKHLLKGENIHVSSAGTMAFDGLHPSEHSLKVTQDKGIDISGKRTQSLTEDLVEESDLVLVMAEQHLFYMKKNFPKYFDKVYLLLKFGRKDIGPGDYDVDDPIGGTIEDYESCFEILDAELRRISKVIKDEPSQEFTF